MTRARLCSLLCFAILLPACGDDGSDETLTEGSTAATSTDPTPTSGDTGEPASRPNWHEDVAPVVAEHCGSCHYDACIAPISMASYAGLKPWATAISADVEMAVMLA